MQRLLIAIMVFCLPLAAQSFWTPERTAETVIYAGAVAADSYASLQNGKPELNPLAKPFVNHGIPMQIIGSSLGFLAGIGPSYLLHRAGHEKASRCWLRTFTVGESMNAGRMIYLYH